MIAYHVDVHSPHEHLAHVRVEVANPGAPLRFSIPAWTPGSYLLREFARYLSEPNCTIDGVSVPCRKVARGTWELEGHGSAAVIEYDVYGHELTVRTPHIDGTHAYFLGSNALVYLHGRTDEPSTLAVTGPDGWTVYCPLPEADGQFQASDYDVLADTPVELGPDHVVHSFVALGVPHRLILWGADAIRLDLDRLERDTRALIEANAATFDGKLPYDNYDFIFHVTSQSRGGLEHLNSTVLATPWRYFDTVDGYREMLELISHEHFHTWNVKRIRPAALGPFDYQNENHTTALWVVEGFTSYFDALNCLRGGVVDADHYLGRLGEDLTRFKATPGRFGQTVAQASWDAWIRLYRPDENTPNRTVSYYLKGALISLVLDLELRARTDGAASLTDVMRTLWADFLASGDGYHDDAIPDAIRRATGVDADELVTSLVHQTGDPDFQTPLERHGVELASTAPDGAWLGLVPDARPDGVRVKHVRADGPAVKSGVYPGDIIVAFDGRRVTAASLASETARLRDGHAVEVHLFRRDRLVTASLMPAPRPTNKVKLTPVEAPTEDQKRLWTAWTGADWPTKSEDRGPARRRREASRP